MRISNEQIAAALAGGPHVCTPETCPAPGRYYVTCVDGPDYWKMSGPYASHEAALADVDRAMTIANDHDGRAWFMSWGTARCGDDCQDVGNLNRLGLMNLIDVMA